MIKVFVVKGPEQGRSFVLSVETAGIGRGAANQVRLNEPSVSRRHATIYRDDDRYIIEDLQSRNRTWINGNAIESRVKVHVQEGIPVAFGNVVLSFGKKCAPDRLPSQYSISIQRPGDDGLKPSTFADRRAENKKELELIHHISIELLGSHDLTGVCEKALDSIIGLLKRIDSGFVFLFDPNRGKTSKIASRIKEHSTAEASRYSRSLVRRAVKEGKAVMMLDTTTEKEANLSDSMSRLWRRGGFPRSYLARSEPESLRWRRELIRTYLERDIPSLGLRLPAPTLRRFWIMVAHYHGQVWNASELARSFGVGHTTVQRYLDT